MTKKTTYTDESFYAKVVDDFLPSPTELVLKEDTVKVTLSLTKDSVDFFKEQAKKNDTSYQRMIRSLLDHYTDHFNQKK